MDTTSQYEIEQEATRLQSTIRKFFDNFSVGTLLNRSGIRKLKGVSPLAIFETIFMLAFRGHNFYRGIVKKTLPTIFWKIHAITGGRFCLSWS